jgi:hypothetical protein
LATLNIVTATGLFHSLGTRLDSIKVFNSSTNLGFSQIQKVADLLAQKQTFIIERDYKIFKVDAQTGGVVSMKMYKS